MAGIGQLAGYDAALRALYAALRGVGGGTMTAEAQTDLAAVDAAAQAALPADRTPGRPSSSPTWAACPSPTRCSSIEAARGAVDAATGTID